MKILQAGNSNFGYVMSKELRKRGIESDLLVSKEQIKGSLYSINDPMSHDKNLDSYPSWMIFRKKNRKGTNRYEMLRFMRQYDLIHAYNDTMPINAMLSHTPYIAQSGGDDLRVFAFRKSINGFLLRTAYKKADQLVYVWPIHKPYVEKLGIKNAIYLPRVWDTNFIKPRNGKCENESLTIFFPTAELWNIKGNDKFLKAFVRLCKDKENVFLYYVDWGFDSDKAKNLLSHPEVKKRMELIPGPISREKMVEYMEKSDILADQFNSGSFTRVGIEAFTFGIPLLINLDEKLHCELHGEAPPVINANSEDEIYSKLKELVKSKDTLKRIGKESQEWGKKHFDLNKNIDRFVEIYERLLKK